MTWLAIDIGGANLKAANGRGYGASAAFELWRRPQELPGQLRRLLSEAPSSERIAVTMSGELADCFSGREEGVLAILDAVEQAAAGRHTRVYWRNGTLVSLEAARRKPLMAAAANWHALATFAAKWTATVGDALLLDIGSTTTDVLALRDGQLLSESQTDLQRLQRGELVYTGVERSPLCGVLRRAPYRESEVPVANELFATMLDVYVLRGDLPENLATSRTADGRPASKPCCRDRLARTICAEDHEFNHRRRFARRRACDQWLARQYGSALENRPPRTGDTIRGPYGHGHPSLLWCVGESGTHRHALDRSNDSPLEARRDAVGDPARSSRNRRTRGHRSHESLSRDGRIR